MNRIRCFILIAIFAFGTIHLQAQRKLRKQANKYFEASLYNEALDLYNQLKKIDKNPDLLFRRGVSNLQTNHLEEAIRDFTFAKGLGYEDEEIYFHTGIAKMRMKDFADAAEFFKDYLSFLDDSSKEENVIILLKQCQFALNHRYDEQLGFVENLGSGVNTIASETHPVQSPTSQKKYYFSSDRSMSEGGRRNKKGLKDEKYGMFSSDMYAVELQDANWTSVSAFHPILNGPKNDLIQGFSPDGQVLFYVSSLDGEKGQIFADTFDIERSPDAFPSLFESSFLSNLGDKDLFIFNKATILFSSNRAGGFGGYDLYISEFKEGEWQQPVNLGPTINSIFDERCPYLTKSGEKLYFSSDRLESFGGFDIYETSFNSQNGKWTVPSNLKMPINSPADDLWFTVSADGNSALLSSNREESIGGYDIFLSYLKNQVTDQLKYTESVSFLNTAASSDSLTISDVTDDEIVIREYYSEPLYYGEDEIILTPANIGKLNRVKDLLLIFKDVKLVLTGHAVKDGLTEFDLYFSIKRAEKAAEYLVENGIDANRIHIRGAGANFPHTVQTGYPVSSIAAKNNRRIDLNFLNVPIDKLNVFYASPVVSDNLKDVSFSRFTQVDEGLSYRIKVASTNQMYKDEIIRAYTTGIISKSIESDKYLYTIGLFDSFEDANYFNEDLISQGFQKGEIIPFDNGVEINKSEINQLLEKYPDLNVYKNK